MSFGLSEYSNALEQAVKNAKAAGILIIAAAGNTGDKGVVYPAAFEEVVAVGAVNKDGDIEDYSAKGDEVEIVAPGELIGTTEFLNSEDVTSGTSLSSPQVAAVASLIWQEDLDMPTMHDCWVSYWNYPDIQHAVCCAHLLRELTGIDVNHPDQKWASSFIDLLLEMKKVKDKAVEKGKDSLRYYHYHKFDKKYDELIEQDQKENPLPETTEKKRGRKKRNNHVLCWYGT